MNRRRYHRKMGCSGVALVSTLLALAGGAATISCNLIAGLESEYRDIVPEGWEGPVALVESIAQPVGCPDEFEEIDVLHDGLTSALGGRDCNCEAPHEACKPFLFISSLPGPSCLTDIGGIPLSPPNSCIEISMDQEYARLDEPDPVALDCLNGEGALEPPLWATNVRTCRGVAGSCIRQAGDVPCPEGAFSSRRLLFGDYQDSRHCDCGVVIGECTGTVAVYGDDVTDPSDPNKSQTPKEACEFQLLVSAQSQFGICVGPVSASYAKFVSDGSKLACSVQEDAVYSGDVAPASPVTVCCHP